MSRLSIYLFGAVEARMDGRRLTEFHTAKAKALLVYLMLNAARPHARSSLASIFWPSSTSSGGRNNLRQTLFRLRSVLKDDSQTDPFLIVDTEYIQFNSKSDFWIDVTEFKSRLDVWRAHHRLDEMPCKACIEALSAGVDLYRDGFLAGFSLSDAPEFDWWTLAEQECCHRLALEALSALAVYYEEARDYDKAIQYVYKQIILEPWRESAYRRAMRLLTLNGQVQAAIIQYKRCVNVLAEEFGVEPSAATTRLHEQIRSERTRSGCHRENSVELSVPSERSFIDETRSPDPVFVAFGKEFSRLNQLLASTLSGSGRTVFIKGAAGSGKTALVCAFARRSLAVHQSLLFISGSCNAHAGAAVPYLPFQEALGMLVGYGSVPGKWIVDVDSALNRLQRVSRYTLGVAIERAPDLLASVLSTKPMTAPPQSMSLVDDVVQPHAITPLSTTPAGLHGVNSSWLRHGQIEVLSQITNLLSAVSQQYPLVIFLDDLQWVDDHTASIIYHLSNRIFDKPILLIGAYRTGAVAMGFADGMGKRRRHCLLPIVNELRARFGDIVIDLALIDGRTLVDELLEIEPNNLDESFRDTLYHYTDGNALFIIELLQRLKARGWLAKDSSGRWTVGHCLDWKCLTPRIQATIDERFSRVSSAGLALLKVASIQGTEFDAEVVAKVAETDVGSVIRTLSELASEPYKLVLPQKVYVSGERSLSHYRFRSDLIHRYCYDQLDTVERTMLYAATTSARRELGAAVM